MTLVGITEMSIFAAFNYYTWTRLRLFHNMEGHFYVRLFSRKLRYRRIAPWLHCNGVAVLSRIGIEQRVAVRFRCVSTRQCLIVQKYT